MSSQNINKKRDIVLIGLVVVIVVAALWPSEDESEKTDKLSAPVVVEAVDAGGVINERDSKQLVYGAAKPLKGVDHGLFPLVAGSVWTYKVDSPKELQLGDTWTLKIDTAPTETEPGVLQVGYGEQLEKRSIWLEAGGIKTDGLPLTEPFSFYPNQAESVSGHLLPSVQNIIEGAVWYQEYQRSVTVTLSDRKGVPYEQKAKGKQRDRAMAKGSEHLVLGAGNFDAWRIDWLGRIELFAGKRPILAALTTEPFRKESTWFASGVGMVRRRVEIPGKPLKVVSFDLIRYERP